MRRERKSEGLAANKTLLAEVLYVAVFYVRSWLKITYLKPALVLNTHHRRPANQGRFNFIKYVR